MGMSALSEQSQISTEWGTILNSLRKIGDRFGRLLVGTSGEHWGMSSSAETMPKQFYFSTAKNRLDQAASLLDALRAAGWKQTFAWTSQDANNSAEYAEIAKAELAGVRDADVLIVLLPGGFGTHVEIGAALALGKPVVIHAPDQRTLETPYPCVFHYHPLVKLLVSDVIDVTSVLDSLPATSGSSF